MTMIHSKPALQITAKTAHWHPDPLPHALTTRIAGPSFRYSEANRFYFSNKLNFGVRAKQITQK